MYTILFISAHTIAKLHKWAQLLLKANSENCGPPLGNKFDLEVGQRSRSKSRHGTIGKDTHAKYQSSTCNSAKVIAKVKFLWQTDSSYDRLTDEWDLMSPRFRESGGQKVNHNATYVFTLFKLGFPSGPRAEGVPTNNQRGRGSGPRLLWGGLDKSLHIVPIALLVRVRNA